MGAAVVEARDGAEALLAGGVPDLQADGGVGGGVEDALGDEGRADSGGGGGGVEGVADVALDEGGFADAWDGLLVYCQRSGMLRHLLRRGIPCAPSTTIFASREELMARGQGERGRPFA